MTVFRRRSRASRPVPTQQVASAPGRAPRGFTLRTTLAYLGLYTALLASALVTVPLRIGEVDPQGKESSLGLVAGVGSLVAVIANPLFGSFLLRFGLRDHITKWNAQPAFDKFTNDHAAGDHREIRGERTSTAKMA